MHVKKKKFWVPIFIKVTYFDKEINRKLLFRDFYISINLIDNKKI